MRSRVSIYSVIILLTVIAGCGFLSDSIDNAERNFRSPDKIRNKIVNPIRDSVRLSALWIGHVTVLLQMDDKVILTDPFFTNNIALMQRRVREAGLDLKSINKLDMILISHPHFDHLNLGSLGLVEKKFPNTNLVFPDGLEEFLPDYSFKFIPMKRADEQKQIYISETKTISGVKITTVAAYHWGGRYGLDGLIWGYDCYTGYIIQYNGMTVYFAGDTSYDDKFFRYLGNKYDIDLALLPVGPCKECKGCGKPNRHTYPEGTIKILEDTKAKFMIPVHYGTIREKSEPDFPKDVLVKMLKEKPELEARTKVLNIGEQAVIISK
jgi:N-acyl-phosphatidylethanolamine-hydrolysing phospholipase D